MELKDFVDLVRRRKGLIIAAFLGVVLTVGAFVFLAKPLYEADAKLLLVDDSSAGLMGSSGGMDLMLQTLGKSDPISTQMEIITTRPILGRVIELVGMTGTRGQLLEIADLKAQIKVEAVRTTNLISLAYRNRDPARAALVVNTLANVFIDQNQRLNQEQLASTGQFIQTQLAAQQQILADAEQKVLDFKKTHQIFSLDQEAQGLVDAQVQLQASRMQVETELTGALAQQADLVTKTAAADAVTDRSYTYWTTTLEQVKGQVTNLLAQRAAIDGQIAQLTARIGLLPPQLAELATLLGNQTIAGEIHTALLQKYQEVRVNQAAKIASIRLIEPAVVPDRPAFPQKKTYLLVAAAVGILLGLGLAMLRERFDDSPRSPAEVREILPYDVLGYIPAHDAASMLYLAAAPRSPASEAVRLVRANLGFKHGDSRKSFSVMITSAMPGEGKSTLAANLSLAVGAGGASAAIVNLDLRRPSFDLIFNRQMPTGITDFLAGEATLEEILVKDEGRNLTIVPSGTVPPNPSELVTSRKVPRMMQYLARHFDVIVYDTPPVTLVAETLDLARHVDGLILVVDMAIATRSALRAMNELVSNKGLVILGMVLNRVRMKSTSYRYGGSYYSHAAPEGA